jgi:hypothetical protein
MVYFAPEAREAYRSLGVRPFWMGYFGSRAAALGQVQAAVVSALFYNFEPTMVARWIPAVWDITTPAAIIAARCHAADEALRRLLGEQTEDSAVADASVLATEAVAACSPAGRALFSAHREIPMPVEPHLRLWQAATLLREFRGDGHVSALLAHDIDGCEAHLFQVASGRATRDALQPNRGWSDADWEAATSRLEERGWLRDETLTAAGYRVRDSVDAMTDKLAMPPWRQLGIAASARLLALAEPLGRLIVDRGGIPIPNPMGAIRP